MRWPSKARPTTRHKEMAMRQIVRRLFTLRRGWSCRLESLGKHAYTGLYASCTESTNSYLKGLIRLSKANFWFLKQEVSRQPSPLSSLETKFCQQIYKLATNSALQNLQLLRKRLQNARWLFRVNYTKKLVAKESSLKTLKHFSQSTSPTSVVSTSTVLKSQTPCFPLTSPKVSRMFPGDYS